MRRLSRVWLLVAVLGFAAVAVDIGCATRTTTVTRETDGDDGEKETTVTTTEEEVARPTGILSTTLHVVGEVIALPFRLVAGLISIIF
ncbi:MAG: hypothetical protein ACREQY_04720 [Candidatus Binatia bacterium]